MKKYLLVLSSVLFFFFSFNTVCAQQTVLNGGTTTAINFPAGPCVYNWTNNNTSIGLAASGTGNIPSFTAINAGSSPVTATITATPTTGRFAYVPNSGDGTVSVVNMTTNTVESTIQVGSFPFAVAASADGSRVYITNEDSNSVSVINTADNTVKATITVGLNPAGVAVSPDGTRAYVSNYGDNTVSVINTLTNSVVSTVTVGPQPLGISVSPNGTFVYVANSYSNTVSVIQTATNTVSAPISVGTHPFGVCFSPDGGTAYITNQDQQSVSVINTATRIIKANVGVGLSPYGICCSPDGKQVYLANLGDNTVSVINTALNTVTSTIAVGALPYGICISPDGNSVYVAIRGTNSISTINTTTNTVSSSTKVGTEPYSFGNFITNGPPCGGAPVTFTITVNPSAQTITAGTATGTISACIGAASTSPNIQQFTVSGNGLTANITATAPAGFEISLIAGNGYGSSVTIPQTSGAVNSTVVYVRSAATASAGSISGNVTLTSPGASNQTVAVTGTVNALPTVNAVANQTVLSGTATTGVSFTGTSNTFTWVNDTPGIGLAASGSGDIASFTAVNTGTSPITATITATPANDAYAYIASSGTNAVSIINTNTQQYAGSISLMQAEPISVAVSPDGTRAFVTNAMGSGEVINTFGNTIIGFFATGLNPWGIAVSPDGKNLYVANQGDNTVSVIDASTYASVTTIAVGANPYGIAVSPDGNLLAVSNLAGGTITLINTLTKRVMGSPSSGSSPEGLAFTPDSKRLYVANTLGSSVTVFNTVNNNITLLATIPVGSYPAGVAISPDGKNVYVTNAASNTLSVISTTTNNVTNTIPVGNGPEGVSVTPDGKYVYEANLTSDDVWVIDAVTGRVVKEIGVGQNPWAFGKFITAASGCSGQPITFTITVNPTTPTITATTASGTISACAGTASASPNIQQFTVSGTGLTGSITAMAPVDFELSLAADNGYGSTVTIPQTSGAASSTVIYVRSAATASTGSISGNVLLTSPGAPDQTVSVTGTVNPVAAASLIISASGNNICAGTPITFTATPTNGGSSPAYQWLLNGINAGTNSATFSSSTFANGDVVSCAMTSSSPCATPANATSNNITMNVTAVVTPSISIVASQNIVCTGALVTFTATPINGGSTPVYQWLVNGNNAGTNSPTFSSNNFADGDIVSCVMTSNAVCAIPASVTSNSTTVGVSAFVSPGIIIAVSQNNICPGTNVTFTATPTNGGNTPVYQWMLNGNNAGTNTPTFASSTLANGDVISCGVTSNATCLTIPDATSNNITMTVNPQATPAVRIDISENNICVGTPVIFTATPVNGGSTPAYQWLLNGGNTGTNSPSFSTIPANGDVVSCVMTSSLACAVPASVTSNSITANIFPSPVVKGGGNKTLKKGNSIALTATTSGNIANITWSPTTGLDNNKILNPKANPIETTLYTITVQTPEGCMATDSVTVNVFDGITIPNTFTPNGDGVNDKWEIQNLKDYQNCTVHIFDRWGAEVYSSTGYYNAWDGTLNGRRLPVGTYYYIINLNDGTPQLSGFVVLIR